MGLWLWIDCPGGMRRTPNGRNFTAKSTEVSHSNEPFVFQQSHPFSLKWQTFRNSQEKQKVAFHENIPMSYYKPCSKILQKAAKGSRSSKIKAKWRDVAFQLSHCTVLLSPLFPPFFSQLLHQLLAWLKNMTKSPKFWLFWLKTRG